MVGSNDIARSKKFYDALFAAMGGQPGVEDARGRLAYTHNGGRFMVSKPIDGKPASHANGGTIGFSMSGPEQVAAWHKAGVANGGTSIEDPPGVRQGAAGQMYLAYLRDPDGNKLCRGLSHASRLNHRDPNCGGPPRPGGPRAPKKIGSPSSVLAGAGDCWRPPRRSTCH